MRAFAGEEARQYSHMAGTAALAMAALVWPLPEAVIVGDPADERTEALRRTALSTFRPGLVVAVHAPGEENLTYPASEDGSPLAYVCAGTTCASPTGDPDEMAALIRDFGRANPPSGD